MAHKSRISADRKISIIAGTLYILGIASGLLSISPEADEADYLTKASANAGHIRTAAFFQFIMTIAYMGFAISLYPVLRRYKQSLAIGFLSFRIIAAVLNIIGFLVLFLLLSLSQQFVIAGKPDSSYFHLVGDLVRTGRDYVNHVAMVLSISIAGLFFYILLYQVKLIPRWMSVWGLSGTILTIIASLLVMFHKIDIITTIYISLNLPLVVIELILASWLIVKGFEINSAI